MEFGKILKLLLVEHDLTQSELALSIGFSQRAVSRWVNEESEPSETAIKKTADFFGVSTDYLLGRSDDFGNVVLPAGSPTVPALSADEQKLLKNYRTMRADLRPSLISMSDTLAKTPDEIAGNTQKKKA